MKLFYYCYERAHSSVVAAYIHLGRLPSDRIPTIKEILAIPEFDQSGSQDLGIPFFLGRDDQDAEVYIIGFGGADSLGLQSIYYLLDAIDEPQDWKFYNSLAAIGWLTKLGGFISKKLKLTRPGRFLAACGIQRSYYNLVELTKRVKENHKCPTEK